MFRIVVFVLMSMSSILGFAQETKDTYTIDAVINNIGSNRGTVYFALYNTKETFEKREAFQSTSSKIQDGTSQISFKDVPVGTYAIACFHDVNDNLKFDMMDNGMPMEAYGISNNSFSYGPPSFDEAKFEVSNTNLTFDIKLIRF